MLLHLKIRDFAIIDQAELDLPEGFTVITGETGAGKSIVVNALSLVLGGRAQTDVIRSGAANAEVQALFDISQHPAIMRRLEERELLGDDRELLLIRRIVTAKGRGRVSINDKLSTRATLHEIVRGLVDISGQHEQQSLLSAETHLTMLDTLSSIEPARLAYGESFRAWRDEREQLATFDVEGLSLEERREELTFHIQEIERLEPQVGDVQRVEDELSRLKSVDQLMRGASEAQSLLYDSEEAAVDTVGRGLGALERLVTIDPALEEPVTALAEAQRLIEEATRSLQTYLGRLEADPDRADSLAARLDGLRRVARKHAVEPDELPDLLARLEQERQRLDHREQGLSEAKARYDAAWRRVTQAAQALSAARLEAAQEFDNRVQGELQALDLGHARFVTEVTTRPCAETSLGEHGLDTVTFGWSANPGEPPKPLQKIASGGELSRLMLAVKSVISQRDLVALYVFDEVDTGLGGQAANVIGEKIRQVSRGHQALVVTHLANIAAHADHQLRVRKTVGRGRTNSVMELLPEEERAGELARMIDGSAETPATVEAARTMLARRQPRVTVAPPA